MLRNIINSGARTTEIYKIAADAKRGTIMTKTLSTATADKASGVGVETYVLDFDYQPTGYLADVDVSAYSDEADIVKAGYAVLVKYGVGEQFATDQVDTGVAITAGDYLKAGTTTTAGKLVKATSGISVYRYAGTITDGSHTLYLIEVVEPKTVA